MRGNCPLACGACPKPKYDGPQATARVYNAWDEEDEGGFIAQYTAKHVEGHEARVLIIGFGPSAPPLALARQERARLRGASSSRGSTAARGSRAHGAAEAEVALPAPASREVLHSAALQAQAAAAIAAQHSTETRAVRAEAEVLALRAQCDHLADGAERTEAALDAARMPHHIIRQTGAPKMRWY